MNPILDRNPLFDIKDIRKLPAQFQIDEIQFNIVKNMEGMCTLDIYGRSLVTGYKYIYRLDNAQLYMYNSPPIQYIIETIVRRIRAADTTTIVPSYCSAGVKTKKSIIDTLRDDTKSAYKDIIITFNKIKAEF